MSQEQVIFYVIGKVAAICGFGFLVGWSIVSISGVMTDASTVLADKAKKIRQRKG
jgi:hypothetical protein